MSTLRHCPIGGLWSVVAPERSSRPRPLLTPAQDGGHCHFCEGNERETEPEVFAIRSPGSEPDSPGWQIRVVPNTDPAFSYPAFSGDSHPNGLGEGPELAARGIHEVVIETPDHWRKLHHVDGSELAALLAVYRSRITELSRRPGVECVALFRNDGAAAGASQRHPHAQVLALPIVPSRHAGELARAREHLRRRGQCITCEMLTRECQDQSRLICQNADVVAITAFAPRFPFETWLIPKRHLHDFAASDDDELFSLGQLLERVLSALLACIGPFDFNLLFQTAPVRADAEGHEAYHWRMELVPRLTTISGLELSTGLSIVTTSPEEAARMLRWSSPDRTAHS